VGTVVQFRVLATADAPLSALSFDLHFEGDGHGIVEARSVDPSLASQGLRLLSPVSQVPFVDFLPRATDAGSFRVVLFDDAFDNKPGGSTDGVDLKDAPIHTLSMRLDRPGKLIVRLGKIGGTVNRGRPKPENCEPALVDPKRASLEFVAQESHARPAEPGVPENLYRGEMVAFPGVWAFQIHRSSIILVTDAELEALADPDKAINLSLGRTPQERSLRQVCEAARAAGLRTLVIAFDHFFAQYRPGQGDRPRRLTPDMPEYIQHIAAISKFAATYGLGLELSLLSPLEVGPAYVKETGESGLWLHYRKGLRDPVSGDYSVQLWRQRKWANNKGPIDVQDAGVRVFAFREHVIHGTTYSHVDPKSIVEISDTAQVDVWSETISKPGGAVRIRVHGRGGPAVANGLDRVLVVQQYKTPEMDYFSDKALPYLNNLTDRYVEAGVELSGFYSDEMHIQQDWDYFGHHEHGQFALRYVSPGLERRFAELYGEQYADLAKYMVYFAYGQEDASAGMSATEPIQHVFGPGAEDIHRTALFRSRYYELLQNGVVDLFLAARRDAEERTGRRMYTRAHATWAESPTIDYYRSDARNANSIRYEYDSRFVWSNTVHQAAAACHDYFKWGEFLTGTGNDHPECGWLDRDYYGMALACSTGIVNELPYSYCAHWGSPNEVAWRREHVGRAFGTTGHMTIHTLVQEMEHRDVGVLMLYPLDLVATEERFGSWMTQYAYANYVTPAKLLEMGKLVDGAIELGGRRFTTLAALFEPFPKAELLELMSGLAEVGGQAIWSGPPPLLGRDGEPTRTRWAELFGVDPATSPDGLGQMAPGGRVVFEGALQGVEAQTILTDAVVDHIHAVTPREGTEITARCAGRVVGTVRRTAAGGTLAFLGYRPRDDQSASMGYETRNWFEVLNALGAYPPSAADLPANDNTELLSRTTPYLFCRFPNGAVAAAPHLTTLEEDWPGGFARNPEEDDPIVKRLNLPSLALSLKAARVNGHVVDYEGQGAVSFRTDTDGDLIAFAGHGCREITIDGRRFEFTAQPAGTVGWAPVSPSRRVPNGAALIVQCDTQGPLRVPLPPGGAPMAFFAEGAVPGQKGAPVESRIEGDSVIVEITPQSAGRWIYGVPGV